MWVYTSQSSDRLEIFGVAGNDRKSIHQSGSGNDGIGELYFLKLTKAYTGINNGCIYLNHIGYRHKILSGLGNNLVTQYLNIGYK